MGERRQYPSLAMALHIEELEAECAGLRMAYGLMQAERDEARAEVERLQKVLNLLAEGHATAVKNAILQVKLGSE